MTEFGYQDTTLIGSRYNLKEKFNLYTILKDLVDYEIITEWQAGYVTSLYETYTLPIAYEKLLLFINSELDRRTNG